MRELSHQVREIRIAFYKFSDEPTLRYDLQAQFPNLFKRAFNSTPAEFVEQLRITEAERRLVSQHLSIENVATSVGFRSTEVFRRAFARRLGVTPSSFQKQSRSQRPAGNRAAALRI